MKNELFASARMDGVKALLKENNLNAVLLLDPNRDNMNRWLLAQEQLPANPPFNRNAMYLVEAGGTVTPLCACPPHPTDHDQFPLVSSIQIAPFLAGNRLGVTNPDKMKATVWDALTAQCPDLELVDLTEQLLRMRMKKTPEEVEAIRRSAHQYDRVFRALPMMLRNERLEREVVVDLRTRLVQFGVESEVWETASGVILTSSPDGGAAAEEPIPYPGRRIRWGDRVNVQVNGYLPDGFSAALGRCYTMGPASEEAERYWALAVEAQHAAAALAKPGATLAEIAGEVNRTVLAPNGIPEDTSCWIYGMGCSRYEYPRLSDASRTLPLETGMVLAIGPQVAVPGKDPYCCLDLYLVTEDGGERLTRLPQDLVEL